MFKILGADGKEYGPVTPGTIHEWIAAGRANLQTKARLYSETEWKTLGDFPEFGEFGTNSGAGGTTPPPVSATAPMIVVAPVPPVVLLEPANLWLRLPAALIDGLLKILCFLPTTIPVTRAIFAQAASGEQHSFAEMVRTSSEILNASLSKSLPLLAVLLLVQLTLLTLRGQSIGKLLLRLRIVRVPDGSAPGFLYAFLLRGFIPFVVEQIPMAGLLFWVVDSCFIFRGDRRCLHDWIAGTTVIRT